MKKVTYLAEQMGEYVYTPRTLREEYVGQPYDKEIMAKTIRSYDDWRPEPKLRWGLIDVEIPDWMTPNEYVGQEINWKYFKIIGGTEALGRKAYYRLIDLHGSLRVACVKLLNTKNFRSDYRASLRLQLDKWIDGDSPFSSPFSQKQQNSIVNEYIVIEAKRCGVIA